MQTKIEKLPKATIKLNITVEVEKVKEAYERVLEEKVKTAKIEGFREGKAPRKIVEEKIGVSNMYGDVVNDLLQTHYIQAIKENHIAPLANPKVEIKEFDLEKDFTFTAEVAIRPEVKMGDYKKALKKMYEEKAKKLKEENAEKLKKGEKVEHDHAHAHPAEIVDVLLKEGTVEFSDILVDEETNRLLSRLLNQAQQIGLTVEDYLKAQGKTADQLRDEYQKAAENNLKAEFILSHLVEVEKTEITEEEIDKAIEASGVAGVQQKAADPTERLYIKAILQKNKLISDFVEELQGGHSHE